MLKGHMRTRQERNDSQKRDLGTPRRACTNQQNVPAACTYRFSCQLAVRPVPDVLNSLEVLLTVTLGDAVCNGSGHGPHQFNTDPDGFCGEQTNEPNNVDIACKHTLRHARGVETTDVDTYTNDHH